MSGLDTLENDIARELKRESYHNSATPAKLRPSVGTLNQLQPTPGRDKSRMMDEVNDTYEKQIAQLRGQIGRLSTYIDRLIGVRPESDTAAEKRDMPQSVLYRTLKHNEDFNAAIRELTSEIERLDNI